MAHESDSSHGSNSSASVPCVHLDLSLDVRRVPPLPWQALVSIATNPLLPTLGEAMQQALTTDETQRLTAQLKPQVEQGGGIRRRATAYLSAHRPHDQDQHAN